MPPPVEKYTLVDTVLTQALSRIRVRRAEENVSSRATYGRILAEDILASADVPPSPTSHWDGYAVISRDLSGASHANPVFLRVVGAAGPGERSESTVGHGESLQVATGTPMPYGADAVVPVESARTDGDRIIVEDPVEVGSHVYAAGEDVRKGETLLRKGRAIRAQDVGLLIAAGFKSVKAWKRPVVSVLATGSELTEADNPRTGKVVNSHSPVFVRLCERLGCDTVDMGIVGDSKVEISRVLRKALNMADLVLTLGGTSAGKHDYIAEAVGRLNPSLLVHGVKMDRGRVTGLAVVDGKPILMMPGPIQGAMNAFILLGLPMIEVLSGAKVACAEVECAFAEPWEARRRYADFRKVVYVTLEDGSRTTARPLLAETESMRVLSQADGYVIVPENVTRIDAGDRVSARILPGLSFA